MKGITTGLMGVVVLLFVMDGTTTAAHAASRSDRAHAREQFELGEAHYNLREFDRALEAFKDVYRTTRDPALLFNIGQCQYKLGDLTGALYSFKAYLRGGREPANRVQVETRIAEIEQKLKEGGAAEPRPAAEPKPMAGPKTAAEPDARTAPVVEAEPDAKVEPSPVAGAPADGGAPPAATVASSPAATALPAAVLPLPETTAPLVESAPVPGGVPAQIEARPFYTRWWFWTAVGVVVAGSVAALLLVPRGVERPSCPSGVKCG